MTDAIRVLVWNEHRHELQSPEVAAIYPEGIHGTLAAPLRAAGLDVRTGTLDEPDQGLTDLDWADVLIWWGHIAHDEVSDASVDRVRARVLDGLGFVGLHSAHYSRPFRRLMGTSCSLKWREADDRERLWVVAPDHPIAAGLDEYIELEREEMYGEFFDIPAPDATIFVSWFSGGEVFRSGVTYVRGRGRIFYFRPGHETYPTYHDRRIQRIIENGVRWAAPTNGPRPVFGERMPVDAR
ncbi:MAG TPA: ThuA domain-containing protein [Candidatus Limnocylindrales bacterium]|nr:ThuA domain-containing protein [Candidatus Limnocylindrales bacterium]